MYRVTLSRNANATVDIEFCTRSFGTALHIARVYGKQRTDGQTLKIENLDGNLTDVEMGQADVVYREINAAEGGMEKGDLL